MYCEICQFHKNPALSPLLKAHGAIQNNTPLDMFNAAKTDIRLLLECLKYQMKSPDSQKQALLTIVSICHQNGEIVEFFKEIGGVMFVYNLSRSSQYSVVKETALYTLGSLAEFNENCKQTLCREEIFCDLAECMKQEASHTQKRMVVYMLSVLVSNNRRGQSLAKNSGCTDILLNIFRVCFPGSGGPNDHLQLWTSVSTTLCGCVNNPQNEENQCTCMCVFPLVREWLLEVSVSRAELAQPICSFIGMTVANNSRAQEYFASVGGLFTLTDVLASMVAQCEESGEASRLAIIITKTLSACIADNEVLAPVLAKLQLVPNLLLMLSSPHLCPRDQLAVVLTLGHCTDVCVEHQLQLLQGGGLPLMISLLTEANDEEVRKAATFVLQSSKKMMESLGENVLGQNEECDLQTHWQSAHEILKRIQCLEKNQQLLEKSPYWCTRQVLLRPAWPMECRDELWDGSVLREVKGQRLAYEEESNRENIMQKHTSATQSSPQLVATQRMCSQEPMQRVKMEHFKDFGMSLNTSLKREVQEQQGIENGKERVETENTFKLHLRREEEMNTQLNWRADKSLEKVLQNKHTAEGSKDLCSPDIFRHPAPMKRRQQRQTLSNDELSLCSELLDSEIERILQTPVASKHSKLRCTGCVSAVDDVDSRTVAAALWRSVCLCEFHQTLLQAESCFKKRLQLEHTRLKQRNANTDDSRAADTCSLKSISKHPKRETETQRLNLCCTTRFINLTPLKRPCETEGPTTEKRDVSSFQASPLYFGKKNCMDRHRTRQNYTKEELTFLRQGVKRFGHSWNTILWAYPFQGGRTNVDLAKKYRMLKRGLAQAPDLVTVDSAEQ